MRQAKKLAAAKKKTLFIGLSAAFVAAILLGFGVSTLANQQKAAYDAKLHATTNQLKDTLGADATLLQKLAKTPDGKKLYKVLNAIDTGVMNGKSALPNLPQLVGVSLVSEKEQRNQANLQEQINTFLGVISDVKALNRYKADAYAALQPVMNQKATNTAQLKRLAGQWKAASQKLKTITPPAVAKEAHARLTESVTSIYGTVAKLPALYSKDDSAGFIAQQKVLTGKIAGLDEVAHLLATLTVESQKALTTHVSRLHDALGL